MDDKSTQPILENEEVAYLTRRPGKAAMRHLYMHCTKTERWVCPQCYRKLYDSYNSRRHKVLEVRLCHPDGSPTQCHHCQRLIVYRNQEYVGPKVNGTPHEVTATIMVHTRHPGQFLNKLTGFMKANREVFEIGYKAKLLPKEGWQNGTGKRKGFGDPGSALKQSFSQLTPYTPGSPRDPPLMSVYVNLSRKNASRPFHCGQLFNAQIQEALFR